MMMRIRLEFKLQDLWIGAFWREGRLLRDRQSGQRKREYHLWLCLLPCVPLHFEWKRRLVRGKDGDPLPLGVLVCALALTR
jgi:hypothetical protein